MKTMESIEMEKYSLEVVECDCGFHLGVDLSYLDQVGGINIKCPSCGRGISIKGFGNI
jgi:hypothetical protein